MPLTKNAVTRDEMAALKRAIVGDTRVVAGGRFAFPGYETDMAALKEGIDPGA